MEPRRSKVKKWTDLPKDFVTQVTDSLKSTFAGETKSGRFIVEGRIYPDEILVRMGYLENGRLKQQNFEVSVDFRVGKDKVMDVLNLAIDVGATMLDELFSAADDADFPRIWQPYEVEGRTIYLQFTGYNSTLEEQANQLLGETDEHLIKGASDEPSAEEIKEQLGLDPEEGEETDGDDDSNAGGKGSPPTFH